MTMSKIDHDADLFFLQSKEAELITMTPEMIIEVENARQLLLVSKTILIELRLKNIDANNIVALAGLLSKRGDADAK